ncbi:MAG: MerR family transcriptional regulator, partial [Dermatophilaceae bacterium]|nr:MerR family transcriptional regulator [Dermatophilaceae bacterium]
MKASEREQIWSIGELAARFELPTNVLRHWETLGLLAPERDASGYRRYGQADLVRVAVILRNKAAGMTLEQIGVLLDGEAAGRHEVLEAHLRDLDERARSIERSRKMTEHALR